MGRPHRAAEGGYVYHVLNRANARIAIFDDDGDFEAFEQILREAVARFETRLLVYCLMPNHWHLIAWPRTDGELSSFVGWLTLTHTQRWHAHRRSAGSGHVYQGRFKSFPIQEDDHFYTVSRYVERNALRGTWCVGPRIGGGAAYTVGHAGLLKIDSCLPPGHCPEGQTGWNM